MTSPTNITQYCTVWSWYMRKRIDQWCSVVPEKIPTLGSTVQWETRQASFPTGTVGPRVGIFLSPLNTNDGFYLSHPRGRKFNQGRGWLNSDPEGEITLSYMDRLMSQNKKKIHENLKFLTFYSLGLHYF